MTRSNPVPLILMLIFILAPGLASWSTTGAQPQVLVLSLAKAGEARSGVFQSYHPVDVLRFEPSLSKEAYPFLLRQNFEVFLGDADANNEFDDAPGNIDAMVSTAGSRRPRVYDFLFSFSAASTPFPGGTVLDGDLVRLQPEGGFQVFASEAVLSSVTGTRTIDIDAATLTSGGELVFSFTDNEVTTNPVLIQQNNNKSTLGDETLLGWMPGTTKVRVVHTPEALIAMVSRAAGKSLTSIVDVVGLSTDPLNPGHFLFTTASSAKGLAGAVFTTAGGGAYAALNNAILDGTGEWGLEATPVLDALSRYAGGKAPLCLEVLGERIVTPGNGTAEVRFHGAVPSGTVQLYLTCAGHPVPSPFPLPPPLNGVLHGYVTVGDPLLYASVLNPLLKVPVGLDGRGQVRLSPGNVLPGVSFLLQGVDLSSYEVSEPVVIDLVKE